jgi:hypothetical protein
VLPFRKAIEKLEQLRIDDLLAIQKRHMKTEGALAAKMAKRELTAAKKAAAA